MSFFPIKLKIRGRAWKIIFQENLTDTTGRSLFGLCDPNKALIIIDKNISKDFMLETILHEYIHACAFEQGVHDEDIPSWFEHMLVSAVSKDMVINKTLFLKLFKQWD